MQIYSLPQFNFNFNFSKKCLKVKQKNGSFHLKELGGKHVKKFSEYFGYLQDKMTKMTEDKIEFD